MSNNKFHTSLFYTELIKLNKAFFYVTLFLSFGFISLFAFSFYISEISEGNSSANLIISLFNTFNSSSYIFFSILILISVGADYNQKIFNTLLVSGYTRYDLYKTLILRCLIYSLLYILILLFLFLILYFQQFVFNYEKLIHIKDFGFQIIYNISNSFLFLFLTSLFCTTIAVFAKKIIISLTIFLSFLFTIFMIYMYNSHFNFSFYDFLPPYQISNNLLKINHPNYIYLVITYLAYLLTFNFIIYKTLQKQDFK